ncbi:MAG: GNAT family N-acetyltransferase [Geminicoccaceae bacterium]|nr:GNAT family N-acetyltransferase [Geminicoccaceae bacterium]MCX8101959.1 GNAT family N-acetyltransferase [Geminicoccaceae bacterium]MDW8369955.1 GNAT family N-acetyltransferase [Geminicoccaceae bacterium]
MPPSGTSRVRLLGGIDELRAVRRQWIDLARRALEANPFYEESFLMPLLEHRGWIAGLRVAVVAEGERLIGLLPLVRRSIAPGGWPPLWRSAFAPDQPHGFLATPLLDRDRAATALATLLDALDRGMFGTGLLELFGYADDGPCARLLQATLTDRRQPHQPLDGWRRGLFRPQRCFESYLQSCLEPKRIRELRRQRRRLEELGPVRLRRLAPDEPFEAWCEHFLAIEKAGWKGRKGTALASRADDAAFFRAMCAQRHREGRLLFEALELGDRPISLSVALLAAGEPSAAFVFKITHDESMRTFGPGVLLEYVQFEAYHAEKGPIHWADSCTGQGREHLDRLWAERRHLGHLLIAPRGLGGSAVLASFRAALGVRRATEGAVDRARRSLARLYRQR